MALGVNIVSGLKLLCWRRREIVLYIGACLKWVSCTVKFIDLMMLDDLDLNDLASQGHEW